MNSIYQIGDELYINGNKVKKPKSIFFSNTVCQINNKVYINGKEYKNGKWRYTVKAIINCLI